MVKKVVAGGMLLGVTQAVLLAMAELLQLPGLTEMDLVAHDHDEGFDATRE